MTWFQSARPRGARLFNSALTNIRHCVSIRAPAWGATEGDADCSLWETVSIRAPAWGATY